MDIFIKNLKIGDEKTNRLLAFLDGEDIKWSTHQPALPQAHVSSSAYSSGEDWDDDDYEFDEEDWREEQEERRQEELAMRAAMCTCGAWQMGKSGVVHVADCCCGAE